jgi:replicative DNA helicase
MPACPDIERAIIVSFLVDHGMFLKYMPLIRPEYFYSSQIKKIIEFMIESMITDILLLTDKFPNEGDKAFLLTAYSDYAGYAHLEPLIKTLKDRYDRRKIIESALKMIEDSENNYDIDAKNISETGITDLMLEDQTGEHPELVIEIAPRLFENLELISKGGGIRTHLVDLNDIIGAIQPAEYIILAGRPSMGKTALALCIARSLSMQKISPLIFSVETSKEVMCGRILFGESERSYDKILRGDAIELKSAKEIHNDAVENSIFIDGTPAISLGHFEATCENYVRNHGVNFIFFDHIGLMKNTRGRSRHEELSEISKGIKSTLQKLKVPGIILCQLSRKVEERHPPIPMLSDLRESGSLEEDSDKVLFIYREEYYNRDSKKKGIAEIIVAKNKNGKTGYTEVAFDGVTMNFRNLEKNPDGSRKEW